MSLSPPSTTLTRAGRGLIEGLKMVNDGSDVAEGWELLFYQQIIVDNAVTQFNS